MVIVVCSLPPPPPPQKTPMKIYGRRGLSTYTAGYGGARTGGEGDAPGDDGASCALVGAHNAPAELEVNTWLPEEGK